MDKIMKSPIVKETINVMNTKIGLYVILFLAITNVLGFITVHNLRALFIFIIVGFLTSIYTKNMSYILATSLVVTNLYLVLNRQKEGMAVKATEDTTGNDEPEKEDKDDIIITPEIHAAQEKIPPKHLKQLKKDDLTPMDISGIDISGQNTNISTRTNDKARGGNNIVGGTDTNKQASSKKDGFVSKNQKLSPKSTNQSKDDDDTRIDYASTLEMAYDNLQTMLGDDGIKGLSSETRRLAKQQQNLISSLNEMAPILKDAQNTLSGLKMPDMSSIKGIMSMLKGKQ